MPVIGVLALQGAFREHAKALASLGAEVRELRQAKHLPGIEGLVIPGGESTTMGKLLVDLDMMDPIREAIAHGLPVYGSCAGLILLCKNIEGSDQPRIGLLRATVRRNAFGRQVDSFETPLSVKGLDGAFHAVFIRAPLINAVEPGVEVLATIPRQTGANGQHDEIVAVRQDNILATSFHPELTQDTRLHQYFLDMVRA